MPYLLKMNDDERAAADARAARQGEKDGIMI
jgi:hypothetical protein